MTKADIAELRGWHRAAIRRSLQAGYDLVYVYAGHGLTSPQHFSRRVTTTAPTSIWFAAEPMRLLRELIEGVLEQCDGRAAVAVRLCVDELVGPSGLTGEEVRRWWLTLASCPTSGISWSVTGRTTRRQRGSAGRCSF